MGNFKKGERVKVLLDETHNLVHDPASLFTDAEEKGHDAVFVSEHLDGQWADVDLEKEHAGGTRRLSVPLSMISKTAALLLFALLSLCPRETQAQFVGFTGLQTVSSPLATNVTCTGGQQSFSPSNLGQISHQASATSSATSFTLEIDGTDNVNATYRISNPAISFANASTTSYIAQGFGYYAKITIVVSCTAGSTFSLSYSGGQSAYSQLIGAPGSTPVGITGAVGQVQGIVTQQQSGAAVNPIVNGSLQSPINANFTSFGLDNFNINVANINASGVATTYTVDSVPPPTTANEVAFAWIAGFTDISTGTPPILSPWQTIAAMGCGDNSAPCAAFLPGATSGTALQMTYTQLSGVASNQITAITLLSKGTTLVQGRTTGSNVLGFLGNTTAGNALMAAARCTGTTPCTISSVTDTQGNTWLPVTSLTRSGSRASGLFVYMSTTAAAAAADTITFTAGTGTVAGIEIAEFSGFTSSTLVQPAVSNQGDAIGGQVVRLDAQFPNQFTCSVTLSTNTTTQCQIAPTTINTVPVRLYVTDIQVSTTVAGTTSSVQVKTGTGSNCATGTANLSAITYSTVTLGLQNVLGARTPLVAPLQSAVCVTQTGGAAGTATIELRGFLAP